MMINGCGRMIPFCKFLTIVVVIVGNGSPLGEQEYRACVPKRFVILRFYCIDAKWIHWPYNSDLEGRCDGKYGVHTDFEKVL